MNSVTQFDLGTEIPKNFYESKKFKQLRQNLENTKQSYFLTGKAGTGKSTFIEYFRLNTKKNVMILAYTGIVAIKCRGSTINRFFGFPHRILKRKDCTILRKQNLLKSLNTLIIDEISMVNPNMLDAIDRSLKVNRENDLPFGGVQMLFVGDVFQLAPISKKTEKELLLNMYPDGNFFFNSKWFKTLDPKIIEFEEIFRQKDTNFIQKLENIRRNQITQEVLDFFNKRFFKNEKKNNDDLSDYQERLKKLHIKYPLIFKNWKDEDGINHKEPKSKILAKYSNHGKRWSNEEDKKLGSYIKIQKCIYEISNFFKRKPSAIRGRILQIVEKNLIDLSTSGLILLTPKNKKVFQVNHEKLETLDTPEFSYIGKVTGDFKTKDMMSEKNLKLKVGAQIMLTKNDPGERWVNGTMGLVEKLDKDKIYVKVGRKIFQVEKVTWEKYDYYIKGKKFEPKVVGTFEQYPIRLAWAATIHKCQGQTFEKAVIDLDTGAFAHGMTYVALSRVKTIEGLNLIRPIRFSDIRFDDRIYNFQKTVELFN